MNLAELEGLIPPEVGELLALYASNVPAEEAIVEVGSYKGKSTCYLAAGARDGNGAHVWAVDPWDSEGNETGRFGFAESSTREAFDRQVAAAGLSDRITPIKGFSVEVAKDWSGPLIGLLYIDGDHQARSVRADYRAWEHHLARGAVVIFDDLDTPRNPGVRVVVDELGDYEVEAGRLAVLRG